MAREDLARKAELSYLSAFYSGLLTDKQREALSLHCEEDMSLGEIAEELNISRQGVHELLTRAAAKMADMEEKLHLADRFTRTEQSLIRCRDALAEGRYQEAQNLLDDLIRLEQEDENGL